MIRMWDALVDRQTGYVNFTPETQAAMAATKVAVIGTGGNGAVMELLARAGFARFVIVDPDKVELTNLNRLPFYPEDAGLFKVDCWRRLLLRINPECEVEAHPRGITRHDASWLEEILEGVKLLFLGTTDPEANLVVGRTVARLGIRMVIGPASSGSAVVSTFTYEGGITPEKLGGFGTEGVPLEKVDYTALKARYFMAMAFPGRSKNYLPEVWEGLRQGTGVARSCGIFVRMTNAVMAFEGVKNAIELNGIPLCGTRVVAMPEVQVFEPRSGCAYLFNVLTRQIGVPDWITGRTHWVDLPKEG